MSRRRGVVAVMTAALVGLTSGCASAYQDTPVPSPSQAAATPAVAATANCARNTAVQTYTPPDNVPNSLTNFASVNRIKSRGYLTVGVSADTLLLGARNPLNGKIEGFDVDLAKFIASAIFGTDTGRIKYRALNAADRVPALKNGDVDLVARALTITCDRWNEIAFSAEYYRASQKLLVKRDATEEKLDEFTDRPVCAAAGSTNLAAVEKSSGVIAVPAASNAGCLVLLQQGKVEAIVSDDVILAGLAAQDPFVKVVGGAVNEQPYGLGISQDSPDLVRYVNAVLAQAISDGRWRSSYTTWLAPALGPAPTPPTPVYGRK